MSLDNDGPLVSVVIPCLNEARYIKWTLDALVVQDFQDFEVIIVDGGSIDATADVIARWRAEHAEYRLRVIANPSRHIPQALNLSASASRGDVIVRLDGHVRPRPDYLRRCVETLGQPGVGVCGGVVQIHPGAPGNVSQAIAHATSTPLGAGDAYYRIGAHEIRDVDTVPFGCFLKATWQTVGGYAEDLLANEDYDFNFRVRKAGWTIRLDPAIQSDYYARSTYRALVRQYWRYGWWKARMLKRHPRALRWRQAVPALWAAGGPVLLGAAVGFGWSWAWIPWAFYGAVLCFESWQVSSRNRLIAPAVLWAYLIIHFAWGWGFWGGLAASFLAPHHEHRVLK